jgi:hypothetical protein
MRTSPASRGSNGDPAANLTLTSRLEMARLCVNALAARRHARAVDSGLVPHRIFAPENCFVFSTLALVQNS